MDQKAEDLSDNMKDMFKRIFVMDPKKRISGDELINHPLYAKLPDPLNMKTNK